MKEDKALVILKQAILLERRGKAFYSRVEALCPCTAYVFKRFGEAQKNLHELPVIHWRGSLWSGLRSFGLDSSVFNSCRFL